MKMNKPLYIVLAATLATVLILFAGLRLLEDLHRPGPPPPTMLNPPIYQGAQNLSYTPRPTEFGPQITFAVSDTADKILNYYDDRLTRDGWKLVQAEAMPPLRSYKYSDGYDYSFTVKVEAVSTNQTEVILLLQSIPPYGGVTKRRPLDCTPVTGQWGEPPLGT